jgi:hypothetical protein
MNRKSKKTKKHFTTKQTHIKDRKKKEKLLIELNNSILKEKPKKYDIINCFGFPINSINDIIHCMSYMRNSHKIEFDKNIEVDMIEEWVNNPNEKNHLVWNCIENSNREIEWFGRFISNKQITQMKKVSDLITDN